MRIIKIILVGVIGIIFLTFCMQLSVADNLITIKNVYASKGVFKNTDNLQVDSLIFYKMNLKNHYIQCKNDSCYSKLEIKRPIALSLFFWGKIYFTYRLMVFDKNNQPVYGCGDVPSWITIAKKKWKWWIVDFHEQM